MESQSQTDEIKGLKVDLEEVKGERRKLKPTDPLYAQFTNEITETLKRMNLLTEQQGKFASPISVVISHSYRSHIFAHSLLTSRRYSHALFSFF